MINNRIPSFSTIIFLGVILLGIIVTVLKIETSSENFSDKTLTRICEIEDTLQFDGVITDYSGFGHKSTPIILLINGSLVKIPRYNNNFALYVGDTIKKASSSHVYYIYRSDNHRYITGKPIDTVSFQCK